MRAKRARAALVPPPDAPRLLKLASVLDLKAAAPLADQLLAVRGSDVMIDASEVERFGALCLQVLLSARLTWKADNRAWTIEASSEGFKTAACLFGAESALFDQPEMHV